MTTHADHRFSVSIYTSDLAILYCLRANTVALRSLQTHLQCMANRSVLWISRFGGEAAHLPLHGPGIVASTAG